MHPSTAPASITLGLDLGTSAGLRRLTFAPGDDRVFTLGSAADADVRIEGPGIDPVHFSLERHNDELWLVPARRGQRILVDARRVHQQAALGAVAVIEFAEQRIVAASYETKDAIVSAAGLARMRGSNDLRRLPGEADVTTPGLPPAAQRDVTHLLTTRQLPARTPTPPAPIAAQSFSGPGFTQRISRGQLYQPPAPPPRVASSPDVAPPPEPEPEPNPNPNPRPEARPEPTLLNARAAARPIASAGEPPATRAAVPRGSLAAAAEPTVVSRAVPSTPTLEVRLRDVAHRLRAPAARRRQKRDPLVSLGRFAQQRPFVTAALVLAVAGAVAVPLAFADKIRRPHAAAAGLAPHAAPPATGRAHGTTPTAVHSTLNPTPEPPLAVHRPLAPSPPGPSVQIVSPGTPASGAATSSPPASPRTARGPADAAVVDAVGALALGRDGQAKLAYERLAARSPENPAYRVLAALLDRFTSVACADPASARTCPEVKR